MKWLAIRAGNTLNCSPSKFYEDEEVAPRQEMLGEYSLDANYHFKFSPTDVVELYDKAVDPLKTITVIPLSTDPKLGMDYIYYDPYIHEDIYRHVETARVVPMPSDLFEMLKSNAQLHPVLPAPEIQIETLNSKGHALKDLIS